ncbi:solute carrier family 25 member 47-A [Periophthalmus magnuspinnatus]|uniref:solute carrier family 25 member 47-A n=1 Tax=Periophthalmus magnuspinnatus TaxID=409849 RepID=UPI00145B33A1|nr:solute carrier family 25 member 47-A [Periophthalmus magnuspinnatus]
MHLVDFVSGSFAGACGMAVGYPLDTVKVRLQTQKQFTGIWQCATTTFLKEGVSGFFKGMALPVTTIAMTSSVTFGVYRNFLHCLSQLRGGGANTRLDVALAGMAGGIAQTSVMAPGDLVKVRLQCQTESKRGGPVRPRYRGPVHCLVSIMREEGVRGLYRGALPLMLRDGPSYATYFTVYSSICDAMTHTDKTRPGWGVVMLAGGVAGAAAWAVGTPMDVIKARIQMDGARDVKQYRGLLHCITQTVHTEGARVFYRSLWINCLRAFPSNMVVFMTYELLTDFLRVRTETEDMPYVVMD